MDSSIEDDLMKTRNYVAKNMRGAGAGRHAPKKGKGSYRRRRVCRLAEGGA